MHVISTSISIKIGPSYLLSENGDLSLLLFFSKQCFVENIQGKFQKNSSLTFFFFLRYHLNHIRGCVTRESLSKDDFDDCENVKNITSRILELNWNQRSRRSLNWPTANQVISRRGKNENGREMYNNEHRTCKACKSIVFHCKICKFVAFLLPSSW